VLVWLGLILMTLVLAPFLWVTFLAQPWVLGLTVAFLGFSWLAEFSVSRSKPNLHP